MNQPKQLQCSARRIDEKTVLLSCGDAFLKTDNAGIRDMLMALDDLATETVDEIQLFTVNSYEEGWPMKKGDG